MFNNINIFDCTIREAGYQTGWYFDSDFVINLYKFALSKGINYVELGFFHNQQADPNRGIFRYCSQKNEELNKIFENIKGKTKLSAMRDIQRPRSELIKKSESVIDIVRIINRSHENDFKILEKEVDYIRNKGYEVFINFTSAGYNKLEQNREFAKFAKKIGLEVIYFADTESVFTPEYVINTIDICKAEGIEVGMPFHDKNGSANLLLEVALYKECKFIDATILGIGGKWYDGNLSLECLLNRLGVNGGVLLNDLKKHLILQLIKYNKFSAAVL